MDGGEATRRIREEEVAICVLRVASEDGSRGSVLAPRTSHLATNLATRNSQLATGFATRTVIVALTASAFEHERERVLAAGCDDFVAKPFREATIFEKLAEHLGVRFVYEGPEPRAAGAEAAGARPAASPDRLAALPGDLVGQLNDACVLSSPAAAERALDRIDEWDGALTRELRQMVKNYQFDEILDLIERTAK
jgi:CheY-like chemotaxis protein